MKIRLIDHDTPGCAGGSRSKKKQRIYAFQDSRHSAAAQRHPLRGRPYIPAIFFLMAFVFFSESQAQMTGNPAGVGGKGEWTIGIDGTYMTQQQAGETAFTRRLFMKSEWGLAPWLDLYALIGGVQLEIRPGDEDFLNYKDRLRLGFGAGASLILPFSSGQNPAALWLGVQGIRFASQGSFVSRETAVLEGIQQEFAMNYDWRELRGHFGLAIPVKSLRLYLAGVVWTVQRLETKTEYLTQDGQKSFIAKEEGEYRSGLWTGAVAGLEIRLPYHYAIGVEAIVFNANNYFIVIGIHQTGT